MPIAASVSMQKRGAVAKSSHPPRHWNLQTEVKIKPSGTESETINTSKQDARRLSRGLVVSSLQPVLKELTRENGGQGTPWRE